ncbi:Phage terminase, large subunit [hydrothermal vent metagenome]|uniref:Phage terminase, large subunit n=1 Tax=hydrothermal vent metagenome TaxID=652676 RepID=A0A3B0VPY5_9ZZZZ
MSEVIVKFPKVYKRWDDPYRYKISYGGRAAARSWTFARKLLLRGVESSLLILCTRELQKSIKDSVHRLLKNQITLMNLDGFYDVTETSIKGSNGTEFIFLGTRHNPNEIRSLEGVSIAWIEEGHALTEDSWDIIDPTIRKEGSEIWISYNTRFKYDTVHKMFVLDTPPPSSLVVKTSYKDNPYLTEVLKTQLATMKEKDYEKYLNIWEGDLKQLSVGAIFGKQITEAKRAGRLLSIPVIANCEVDTFSDLGKKDQTAFWFMQRVGNEYRFIDYYENRLEDVDHYTRVLKALNYNYGTHYMPHDAAHQRLGMKRNIKEQFEDGGINPITVVKVTPDKSGAIQMARDLFSGCWFHKGTELSREEGEVDWLLEGMQTRTERMERGFDALCNYRYKYNDTDDVFQQKPHHDWASNGADAFLQFAQGYVEHKEVNEPCHIPNAVGAF